ncbi:MAG: hypothetical protein HFI68_02180 [Lachnospiraceae bacterium]|nr:hypothetical protein [Lachnospiraceae bacterium]
MDRQTMIYVGFFLAVCVILFAQSVISGRRRMERLKMRVREQWGKIPKREYSLEEFEKISHYYERRKGSRFYIDDITWNDMGMDDIFLLLNTADSAVGEEYLYWALRTPEFDEEVLKERSELADFFRANQVLREQYKICFGKMGRRRRVALSDYIGKLSDMPSFALLPHVAALLLLWAGVGVFFIKPAYGVGALIGAMIVNLITYYKSKGDMAMYFACMSQVADLVEYGGQLADIRTEEQVLIPYREALKENCGILKQIRKHAWILVDKSDVGGNLVKVILDYLCMITHIDLILFRRMAETIRHKGAILEQLMETMGQLELALCIGSFRDLAEGCCRPVFHKEPMKTLACKGIYHPLVENAVANSIETDKPVLITGSNASGKSTFLKTIGVNAILAQSIYTVTAASYETDFFRVYSSMALSDSLETKESYYMVEIKSLKRILDALSGKVPVLCFVDEVLRGTNTVERISASSKILESMAGKNVLCFAATHDIELTALLEGPYVNYHFEEQVEEGDVSFSYRLEPGRARSRNAIRLLGIMGYDEKIIAAAEEMAKRFVKSGEWLL